MTTLTPKDHKTLHSTISLHVRAAFAGICVLGFPRFIVSLLLFSAISLTLVAQEDSKAFDVPAGAAEETLRQFSAQSGVQLAYATAVVQGVRTNGVHGDHTPAAALEQMVAGTELIVIRDKNPGAFAIRRAVVSDRQKTNQITIARPVQQREPNEPVIKLQEFVVTGSNIRRIDMENVLPVTVISREAMEARSAITPVEMLTALPLLTNVPINESTTGSGASARGDSAHVDLRGIGASNTLILLNGRRLIPSPTSGITHYSPNVSQLPTQGISSIEVLRDGASSIYGSDAVAGVINYIMRRDLIGTETKIRYAYPEAGNGQNIQTTLIHGLDFADGRGRLLAILDYLYRDGIMLRDRDFTKSADHSDEASPPFNVPGSAFDRRSVNGFWPSFRIGEDIATNYFRPVDGVPSLTGVAPTPADDPEFYLNSNEYFTGLPYTERYNAFTGFEFDITDQVSAFSDVLYYYSNAILYRPPIALTAPSADKLGLMSAENPYNPYGSHFYHEMGAPNADGTPRLIGTPRTISLLNSMTRNLPGDTVNSGSQVYRIVAGLRGKLADSWAWESAVLYSSARTTEKAPYNVRESLLLAALARADAAAYNPFGYTFKVQNGAVVADQPYDNPPSVMSTFVQEWRRDGYGKIASIDARASGKVLEIWNGEISLALGGEYRHEEFATTQPPFASVNPVGSGMDAEDNDFIQASPRPNNGGDRTVTSFYAEAVIPLAAPQGNIPLANRLELTGSVRHERYNDFGSSTKPKFGLNWNPVRPVMIRASYNEGFTAPNLPILNQPSQFSAGGAVGAPDPYRNPVTNEGSIFIRQYNIGNPNLRPTTSEGVTAGIVLAVPTVKGLTLTADYWKIDQADVIGSVSVDQRYERDAALLRAYTQQQLAAGVPIGSIDVGSGTVAYKGDPDVVRFSPTPQDIAIFSAYNAANPNNQVAVAGRVESVITRPENRSSAVAEGWDFGMNYVFSSAPIGRISINSDWSYLVASNTTFAEPGKAPVVTERLGVNGAARWRGSSTVAWRKNSWSTGLSAYYIGEFEDIASTTEAIYESLDRPSYIKKTFTNGQYVYRYVIDDVLTFNAFVSYRFSPEASPFLQNTSIRFSVVNLRDERPPLASGNYGYSTGVHGNMLPGRTWGLEITRQF